MPGPVPEDSIRLLALDGCEDEGPPAARGLCSSRILLVVVGVAALVAGAIQLPHPALTRVRSAIWVPLSQKFAHAPVSTKLRATGARRGSFLVLGDWGWDPHVHGGSVVSNSCQRAVADKMHLTMEVLGDVKFVVNVGDSFYPNGVSSKDDPQWDLKWRQLYSPEIRSVPWYSVYGNHDYHSDPCACSDDYSQCAQVNADIEDRDFFYMPSPNWHIEHPELELEVVGLDLNQYMWAWSSQVKDDKRCPLDCFYTKCQMQCELNLKHRSEAAQRLLRDRLQQGTTKNLVVFSHYPTDYLWNITGFLDSMRQSERHIEYFGGHRHSVNQKTTSIYPQNNWLVGGGGGWSCDSPDQGFVVGEIGEDYRIHTYSVLVDPQECCVAPAHGRHHPGHHPGHGPAPTCLLTQGHPPKDHKSHKSSRVWRR